MDRPFGTAACPTAASNKSVEVLEIEVTEAVAGFQRVGGPRHSKFCLSRFAAGLPHGTGIATGSHRPDSPKADRPGGTGPKHSEKKFRVILQGTATYMYVAAALAGKVEDAVGLTFEGRSPRKKEKVEDFKSAVDAQAIKMPTLWSDDMKGQAIAVSEEVKITKTQPDGQGDGHLVIALVKSGDKCLVKDID